MAECVCDCGILPDKFSWIYVADKKVEDSLKKLKNADMIESKILTNSNMFPRIS